MTIQHTLTSLAQSLRELHTSDVLLLTQGGHIFFPDAPWATEGREGTMIMSADESGRVGAGRAWSAQIGGEGARIRSPHAAADRTGPAVNVRGVRGVGGVQGIRKGDAESAPSPGGGDGEARVRDWLQTAGPHNGPGDSTVEEEGAAGWGGYGLGKVEGDRGGSKERTQPLYPLDPRPLSEPHTGRHIGRRWAAAAAAAAGSKSHEVGANSFPCSYADGPVWRRRLSNLYML